MSRTPAMLVNCCFPVPGDFISHVFVHVLRFLYLCVLIWGDKLVSTFLMNGKAIKFRAVLLFTSLSLSLHSCIYVHYVASSHVLSARSLWLHVALLCACCVWDTLSLASPISVWKHTHTHSFILLAAAGISCLVSKGRRWRLSRCFPTVAPRPWLFWNSILEYYF